MGRQINFYFNNVDEEDFLNIQKLSMEGIVFIQRYSRNLKYRPYKDFNKSIFERSVQSQVYLAFPYELSEIKYLKISDRDEYFLDTDESPVIEYCRSGYNPENNLLVSGRIWCQFTYWTKDNEGEDILLRKSTKLIKLYESLERWVRRHCKRLPNGIYIAPNALKLYEGGAKLSP